MPDKAKQDSSAPDTPRIVEQLTALLERQATPHDSFRLPLAVPTYEGHTDKKSVADFLQELQDYRDAQALTNETLLLRVLPVALSGSAARWRRRQSFESWSHFEQPGASQRPRRRVFWSSHHPAARKHSRGKPSTKQCTPKGTKPHPFPLGQLPEKQPTNAPGKCSPPDNSHGVLDNTVSDLPSSFTLLVAHADKAPLVMVSMAGVKVPALLDTG
ncbi:hypothetical protein MTO96_011001 [Rhipicephalus appendiculatus]